MATAEEGFSAFFEREYPRVLRAVAVVVRDRNQVEEITQDAFAHLLGQWRRVRRYERPDAWVRTVAVRLAVRRDRRERLRRLVERSAAPAVQGEGELHVRADIVAAVAKLPVKQRAAVALYYLEDLPVAEVAEIVGCRASTVSVHLHRARERLAELLSEEVIDDVGR